MGEGVANSELWRVLTEMDGENLEDLQEVGCEARTGMGNPSVTGSLFQIAFFWF